MQPPSKDTPAPTTEERRWTIYKAPGELLNNRHPICGPDTEQEWIEVVEASAYDALARELEEARRGVMAVAVGMENGPEKTRLLEIADALAHHPEEGD